MNKILRLAIAGVLLAGGMTTVSAGPGIPVMMYPTAEDHNKMLNEADDLIDEMADGLQDHQADAIYHALRGVGGELATLRKSRNTPSTPMAGVERVDIQGDGRANGLAMRLYRPKQKTASPLPLLVYFHGGGWTIGSIESCAAFCDALAATGKVMVLAVDYRLAPENQFPAGLNDCEGSIEYAMNHAAEWGSKADMVSAGGDSAGGNLALASAMELSRRKGMPAKLKSLVLIYPVVKSYKDGTESWKEYSRGYGLDGRLMEAFNEAYAGGPNNIGNLAKNPKFSPAHATDADLKELPPVLMIAAERDILCDQGEEFAVRLKKLGNKVERIEFPGAIHTFVTVKGQPTAFNKAVELTELFLK